MVAYRNSQFPTDPWRVYIDQQDILENRTFDDVVCYCAYPVDIHSPADGHKQVFFPKHKLLAFSALFLHGHHEIANLIVTGRCISANFEAQARRTYFRDSGVDGARGGGGCRLCGKNRAVPQKLSIFKAVQTTLLDQGATLGCDA